MRRIEHDEEVGEIVIIMFQYCHIILHHFVVLSCLRLFLFFVNKSEATRIEDVDMFISHPTHIF